MPTDQQHLMSQASNSRMTEPCREYNVQKEKACVEHVRRAVKRQQCQEQLRQDLTTRPRDGGFASGDHGAERACCWAAWGTEEQRWLHQLRRPVDQCTCD